MSVLSKVHKFMDDWALRAEAPCECADEDGDAVRTQAFVCDSCFAREQAADAIERHTQRINPFDRSSWWTG